MPAIVDAMIRLEHVSKRYAGASEPAVDDVSLEIEAGELVTFVGPSGCGKTTTLKMINRMIEPSSGTILVGGTPVDELEVTELRRSIGYVIQRVGLFPHWTVADNIATVPRLLGWQTDAIDRRVRELAGLMGLADEVLYRYPAALSGGQQQRVGVARALAAEPPVLLMDEPFAAVDPIVREQLQDQLLELQARLRKTIVVVTHDVSEALRLGDRIAVFGAAGRVVQFGTPENVLKSPATDEVAAMFGRRRALRFAALQTLEAVIDTMRGRKAPAVPRAQSPGQNIRQFAGDDRVDDALAYLLASPDATYVAVSLNDQIWHLTFADLQMALSWPTGLSDEISADDHATGDE